MTKEPILIVDIINSAKWVTNQLVGGGFKEEDIAHKYIDESEDPQAPVGEMVRKIDKKMYRQTCYEYDSRGITILLELDID